MLNPEATRNRGNTVDFKGGSYNMSYNKMYKSVKTRGNGSLRSVKSVKPFKPQVYQAKEEDKQVMTVKIMIECYRSRN